MKPVESIVWFLLFMSGAIFGAIIPGCSEEDYTPSDLARYERIDSRLDKLESWNNTIEVHKTSILALEDEKRKIRDDLKMHKIYMEGFDEQIQNLQCSLCG